LHRFQGGEQRGHYRLMDGKERGRRGISSPCGEGGWRASDGGRHVAVTPVFLCLMAEEAQGEVGH
jgi:hypothetical protein